MILKFKPIKSADDLSSSALSSLVNLDTDHFPTPWSQESWDKLFYSFNQRFVLLAQNEEQILGFTLFDTSVADSFAHLLKIVVSPNVRGLGIGKKLLSESLDVLNTDGIKSIFLEVEEFNTVAINLYESLGFKIIHHKKQFYSSGANALIMTLSR